MPVSASSQQEFSDADWRAVSSGDQSKKLKFLLSAISANTTRVWTVPDADVTLSAFVATLLDDADAAAARATLGAVNIAGDTMTGGLTVPSLVSGSVTIADDAAGSIGNIAPGSAAILWIWNVGFTTNLRGVAVHARTSSSPGLVSLTIGNMTGVDLKAGGTNLTGTTGTDGNISLSALNGDFKIENRSGVSATYRYLVMGGA